MTELQGSRYHVDPANGILTITDLRISDTNIYHCIATNYINSDTAVTAITVEGSYAYSYVHNNTLIFLFLH